MLSPLPSTLAAGQPPPLGDADLAVMRSAAAYQARRIARTMRLPHHAVEDIEQDILLTVLTRRRYFDCDRGPWVPFVHRVAAQAAQQVADGIAAERRLIDGSLDDPASEHGTALAERLIDPSPPTDPLRLLHLERIMNNLPPRLRSIAAAAVGSEGDYGEASRAMGLSPVSFHRGLAEVRRRLNRLGFGPERRFHDLSET